jgi:hypothetical protein
LDDAKAKTGFPVLYPCRLSANETLTSITVSGDSGKQSVTMVFAGDYEMTVRQSQVAPAVNPDPTGATHTTIDFLPGVRADLIERNDGSRTALYDFFWQKGLIYYELLAVGPPQQREQLKEIATSLQ